MSESNAVLARRAAEILCGTSGQFEVLAVRRDGTQVPFKQRSAHDKALLLGVFPTPTTLPVSRLIHAIAHENARRAAQRQQVFFKLEE